MNDINLFPVKDSIYLKKISSKSEINVDEICDGYLIDADEKECRKIVEFLRGKKKVIGVFGRDNIFNRRAVETLKVNFLVSPERGPRKDSLKQRDSGLNKVVAKEALKNKIAIVISLSELSGLSEKEKALKLEKMIQNIEICKKSECDIKIASLATQKEKIIDEKARKAFGMSLGMSSLQSKNSAVFLP
jgi:ribonuclease P/MRP protein subunit RPP1